MNLKVFIIIVALLVIVYITVSVFFLTGEDSFEIPQWAQNIGFEYDDDSGEVGTGSEESDKTVGDRLSKQLTEEDLGPASSFCRTGFADKQLNFTPDQSKCEYIIKALDSSTSTVRKLSLEMRQGSETRVLLTQEGQLTVDENLTPESASISLDIFDEGGQLTIECTASEDDSGCQIALE